MTDVIVMAAGIAVILPCVSSRKNANLFRQSRSIRFTCHNNPDCSRRRYSEIRNLLLSFTSKSIMSKLLCRSLFFFAAISFVNGFFIQGNPARHSSTAFKSAGVETAAAAMPEVKVGDKIPSVVMMEGLGDFAKQEVNIAELIAGKKVAVFGVPGAFTPGCSKSHLPSFIEAQDELKAKGVELTICIATNDVYVMEAWGRTSGGADARIKFLSDHQGELTEALGLTMPTPMMPRTKRFSLIADDGVVTHYFSSDENASDTWAPAVLAKL